jgi:3-oxoacyl-[acyl-carrier protein] reductase
MDLGLRNKVVFVAGSSRGIGRAIAAEFLSEGASVVLTGRDEVSLAGTHAELETPQNRDRLLSISGDLLNQSAIDAAFDRAVQKFGAIDHLVANVGTGKGQSGWDLADAEWQRLFLANFFASVRLTQAALPRLISNPEGGSILYVASIVGLESTAAPLPYSAAKAALLNYSKNLSRELANHRIRVNSIAPGNILFAGGSWDERNAAAPEQVQHMLDAQVPQRRFGAPRDVASLAAFLCSAAAGFTTGACYVVDGGQTHRL